MSRSTEAHVYGYKIDDAVVSYHGWPANRMCAGSPGDQYGWNQTYCNMPGSYQVRPFDKSDYGYNSYNLDRIQGKAVASDTLYGWFGRAGIRNRNNGWQQGFRPNAEELLLESYTMNHDLSYNVLFTDGSVKTHGDAGANLFKDHKRMYIMRGFVPNLIDMAELYKLYFDPLYAQD